MQKYGLKYGFFSRTIVNMKTTIEIDETLLKRVMRLAGLKTRKSTIAYALREAEKSARVEHLLTHALDGEAFTDAVDPEYDLISLRDQERPGKQT
jgi:Arc/MetJ family transcription regulator